MSRFYKKNKKYYHGSDGEIITCVMLMFVIYLFNSTSNMIFIKPNIYFKINFTGLDKTQYNISSFSCKDKQGNINFGTNITFPCHEQSIHNLIFNEDKHSKLPDYVSLVPLILDSNNCVWGEEMPLKIKDKRENTDISFYIPKSGIYKINQYYNPQMYSLNYK